MSKFEQMQKVGEERKKEKPRKGNPSGQYGLVPKLPLQRTEFLNLSPKLSQDTQEKDSSNVMDINCIQHLMKLYFRKEFCCVSHSITQLESLQSLRWNLVKHT